MNQSIIESLQASPQPKNLSDAAHTSAAWKPLYRIGGGAALLAVACIVAAIAVFLAWPPPITIENWFALFQRNAFLGLLDLDLLLVPGLDVYVACCLFEDQARGLGELGRGN